MSNTQHASLFKTAVLASGAIILAGSLMLFPKEALEASTRGLTMWWEVVFPSLLPFFIVSELLIGFGVVSFLGALLEPLMRPLFRVPGIGGFVWAMGLASGNPAGAKLAARMRQENRVTRIEGERLAAFTNSSNPLFIFGAIAVGFFHDPALGFLLAISHYAANILVGLCMRFYGNDRTQREARRKGTQKRASFKEALSLLHQERIKDGRSIGILLGDAVRSSIQTLLLIGGFIILFAVLNKLLEIIGIIGFVSLFLGAVLSLLGLSEALAEPMLAGLFEITIGAQLISDTENASLLAKTVIVSFILAFGGFSIQAQVASILAETDIRFRPFFLARLLHGVFAASLAFLLFHPLYARHQATETTTGSAFPEPLFPFGTYGWSFLSSYGSTITFVALVTFVVLTARKAYRHAH
ncbi:sporulation integral membrane protein YlbJ [Shouchella shacheensis]|uniref:sporulation integral membrane protein YlbJ n=1 Tax=Shouchella shacheensis TaxID=1649580 RepID=UPI00073FE83B|nr:sporulation integral membrane protein YlbJ [Shouchella shacheensis]